MLKKFLIPLVIFVFIISVVLVIYKILNPKNSEILSQGNYIEVEIMSDPLTPLDPSTADSIKVGSTIYDSQGRAHFKITVVTVTPMKVWNPDSEGKLVESLHPYFVSVYIKATSINKKASWAYLYGTSDLILSGAHLAIYGENWKIWGVILSVKEIK